MAGYKKQHTDGPNSEDKALDLFAEMMIEKIESIRKDWRKPWFTEGALQWPRNLSGREYNGMNAIMLLIHCEKEGYKVDNPLYFSACFPPHEKNREWYVMLPLSLGQCQTA